MPEEPNRPLKVFLCHASGDKPVVRALYQRLIRDGVDAWLDKEKLLPGQHWQLEIPKAVREADVVVICLSKKSITKEGYVQKEIKFPLDVAEEKPEGTIFLIPARLEECDAPSKLSFWQWVDLFEADGYDRLMLSLRLRADKLGMSVGNTIYTDEELEQRLDQLYTEGLAALWIEDWDKAYHRFQSILHEKPDHILALAKLEEAKRQKYLNTLYNQALDVQKTEDWQAVVQILEKLSSEVTDYKDAPLLLKNAQKKNQLARFYEEAQRFHKARQWEAVVKVFAQINAIEPNYRDKDNLLLSAEKEAIELRRVNDLNILYSRAVREVDSGHWYEARELMKQIQETEPSFLETERLLAKVDLEVKKVEEKQWREDQVGTLYKQAVDYFRSRMWREALNKANEIYKLDEQFIDSEQIAKQAQNELEREEQKIELQNKLTVMYTEAVTLLREKKYQGALEKWQEIVVLDPKYHDSQKVEAISKKKLVELGGPQVMQSQRIGVMIFSVVVSCVLLITFGTIAWPKLQTLLAPTGTGTFLPPTDVGTEPVVLSASPTPSNGYFWDFKDGGQGWSANFHDTSFPSSETGYLTFTIQGSDPYIYSPTSLEISAFDTPIITVNMRIVGYGFSDAAYGAIYFITDKDGTFDKKKRVPFLLSKSNTFVSYTIDMKRNVAWHGMITQLRLDPIVGPDLTNEIQIGIKDISVNMP